MSTHLMFHPTWVAPVVPQVPSEAGLALRTLRVEPPELASA